jgi:hypothetical protein
MLIYQIILVYKRLLVYKINTAAFTSVETVETSSTLTASDFSVILLLTFGVGPVSNATQLVSLTVRSIRNITELFRDDIASGSPATFAVINGREEEMRLTGISHYNEFKSSIDKSKGLSFRLLMFDKVDLMVFFLYLPDLRK